MNYGPNHMSRELSESLEIYYRQEVQKFEDYLDHLTPCYICKKKIKTDVVEPGVHVIVSASGFGLEHDECRTKREKQENAGGLWA